MLEKDVRDVEHVFLYEFMFVLFSCLWLIFSKNLGSTWSSRNKSTVSPLKSDVSKFN